MCARYLRRAAQCPIASSSRAMLDGVFRSESSDAPSASPPEGPGPAPARLVDACASPGRAAQVSSGPDAAMRADPGSRSPAVRREGRTGGVGDGEEKRIEGERGRWGRRGGPPNSGRKARKSRNGTGRTECAAPGSESEEEPNCKSDGPTPWATTGRSGQLLYRIRILCLI